MIVGKNGDKRILSKPGSVMLIHHCAAGEDPAVLIGIQRDGQMLPVNKVWADGMSPMHRTPQVTVWVILIEQVIFTVEIHQAVGIVHPIGGWCKVECRAIYIHDIDNHNSRNKSEIRGSRTMNLVYPKIDTGISQFPRFCVALRLKMQPEIRIGLHFHFAGQQERLACQQVKAFPLILYRQFDDLFN